MYELEITNYQIIKHGKITFKPGLTLITGQSNNGKSSIFKAFKQLAYNTPGSDYISHNTNHTSLKLTLPNQDQILYYKSKNDSHYQINQNQPLSKIGSQQVPQIAQLLHIDKTLNYNFWNQLDKPFLISLSPKEQFDLLQQSPHTQTLQSILQNITQDRKNTQQLHLQQESQLQLIQQQNTQYQNQLTLLPNYTQLYTQITSLKDQSQHLLNLKNTLNQYNSIDTLTLQFQLKKYSNLPNTSHLENTFTCLQNSKNLLHDLLQTQNPINETHELIKNLQIKIDQLQLYLKTNFKLCPLCNQPFHNDN